MTPIPNNPFAPAAFVEFHFLFYSLSLLAGPKFELLAQSSASSMLSFLCLSLCAALVAAVDEPSCYWPDVRGVQHQGNYGVLANKRLQGSLDTTGFVCNLTAVANGGASPCCRKNDACYESGSCFQDWSGVTYRQSCTDSSWRDPDCPSMCLSKGAIPSPGQLWRVLILVGKLSDSVWIQQCNISEAQACCLEGASCCEDESNYFQWKPGYITAVINSDGSNRLLPYIEEDANSSSSGGSSTSAPTSANSATTSTLATNTGHVSSSISTAPTSTDVTKTRSAAIAVGVLFGLLWLLSSVGMVVFWRKYKTERTMRLAEQEKPSGNDPAQRYYQQQHAPTFSPIEMSTENTLNELPVRK